MAHHWRSAERVASSQLLYPEARAAVARAARAGRIPPRELPAARVLVERYWRDLYRIRVTEKLARRAGELAEEYRLRAYDAVHFASAASIPDADVVVVSADGALLEAAGAFGIATALVP